MKVIFTKLAARETRDAQAMYELEFSGLGSRFTEELKGAVERIVRHPHAWSFERGEVRRCLLQRFPYKVL